MLKKATIRDVAKMAGVAPSTVSFVLNHTENQSISKTTQEKVLEAAKALNYRPNYMASNMRSNLSKTIGIVASYNVYSMYFSDMLTGVIDVAEREGYGVLICGNGRRLQENRDFIKYFLSNRIDGILFLSSAHSEQNVREEEYIKIFDDYKIPFVTVYGYTNEANRCYVNIDFYQCGFQAGKHLLENACQKIAYIAPLDKDNISRYAPKTELDKQRGFEDAVNQYGTGQSEILYLPRIFKEGNYGDLLQRIDDAVQKNDFDGFVTCWATYGMQLLAMSSHLSYAIPDRFKVIALDTVPYLEHTSPGLSSMQLPFFEIAQKATDILIHHYLKRDWDGFQPKPIFLPCKVMERESSAKR